jgi:phosphohistidine phosphatase
MAKNLFLVRHAKSDWSISGQKDIDRELNVRGINDAPRMGRKLHELNVKPDLIISSPANRAKNTAEFIAEQLQYDTDKILLQEEIYEASVRSLLAVINDLSDNCNAVMIVGHNPTFTYIGEYLTKQNLDNVPTCGVVHIEFEIDSWKEVSEGNGILKMFIYPKNTLE